MALLKTFIEAAEEIGCTERALRRAVIRGDLNVVRMGKSSRSDKIHPEDLDNYIELLRQRGQALCRNYNQSRPEETLSTLTFRTKAERLEQLLTVKSDKKI